MFSLNQTPNSKKHLEVNYFSSILLSPLLSTKHHCNFWPGNFVRCSNRRSPY
uniref:Uncharacterized protein n=1 Tax=Anguilla anguilla TaxID=7936 RepID=A0A0E9RD58_ANGAN